MPQYQAMFALVEGLSEKDVGSTYRLKATERKEAEHEARQLPHPEEANSIKLIRDGQYEAPKLWLKL